MNPLTHLKIWSHLQAHLGQHIYQARQAGHTWKQLQEATGLSRQALNNHYNRYRQANPPNPHK